MIFRSSFEGEANRLYLFPILAACIGFCSVFAPAAYAGESGMSGWAFCTTYAPYSSAYVAGDPVYASEVFRVDGSKSPNLERLWKNFLTQKYGWTKSANCSIATGSNAQANALKTSGQFTEQAGPKLIHTGWKAGWATGAATTAAPPGAASASAPVSGNSSQASPKGSLETSGVMYWVCTWFNTNSTVFISDAFSADNKLGPTELVPPFINFVSAKFGANPHISSPNCIYNLSESDAKTYLQQRIAKPPSGMHVVQTGWRYGAAAVPATIAAAPVAAAPAAAAAPPAANATAAAPAQSAPPVTLNITLRLVDAVNSSTDQAGKRYRAVVIQAASAGSVKVPVNTLGMVTLVQQSLGNFSAQLVSLRLNGQDVPVTSTALTATSMTQQVAKKLGGFLSSIGNHSSSTQVSSAINPAGNHVAIPPGTSLTFTTTVPQAD